MKKLKKDFKSRDELIKYVKNISPWSKGPESNIIGGNISNVLSNLDPISYGRTRNYGNGSVSKLSPYISHSMISINEIRNYVIENFDKVKSTKFIQELAWRDFWHRMAITNPDWIWNNVENYKTGYSNGDYSDSLYEDIKHGCTGVACIDDFILELITTGYIHNHARMYLASYIVHFRRVKWQEGAKWFLEHLLDADEASNNFSWQWIASTFSNKPYIFNLENVTKYFKNIVNVEPKSNKLLDNTYDYLLLELFPNLKGS